MTRLGVIQQRGLGDLLAAFRLRQASELTMASVFAIGLTFNRARDEARPRLTRDQSRTDDRVRPKRRERL